jgi:hypothetical protein
MPDKSLIGAIGIALTLFAFYPYIRSIVLGTARPHVFSWVIWGITTFVVFLAQLQAGGGIGAWVTGVSGTITLGVALLAWLRRADVNITRTDWVYFVLALLSIPLWYATSDPLWAVVVLTTVDLLGFGPTLRKLHADPHSESLGFYALIMVRNGLSLAALQQYSLTTVLFPAAIGLGCGVLVVLALLRRRTRLPH